MNKPYYTSKLVKVNQVVSHSKINKNVKVNQGFCSNHSTETQLNDTYCSFLLFYAIIRL